MSKVFNCWFWKKKNKSQQNPIYVQSDGEAKEIYSDYHQITRQNYKPHYRRRTTESLSQDPIYLERSIGLRRNKKVRSYPVSPVRTLQDDKGYSSDQKVKHIRDMPYKRSSAMVYTTNVSHNPHFKPGADESNEPFPYQIPVETVPRRSSLFYGVKYENNPLENSKYPGEKPIEDYIGPSTFEYSDFNSSVRDLNQYNPENISHDERHVTVLTPNTSDSENGPAAKTIVRFRPHSSGSCTLSDLTKVMPLRADEVEHPPDISSRYVNQFPIKPSRQTSILITNDGRRLRPVQKDRVVRASIAAPESEVQPVIRVSMVKPSTKDGIVPRKSVNNPVVNTSRALHTENENKHFPFNQKENTPLVYAVPVIPTRGRTKSILYQSVKSLSSKKPNEGPVVHRKNIRYSMDTDVFSPDVRRRSVRQHSPGYINMEKGRPMLVSEVLNPITSLFISDLKDPIPKDPLTKPKEANVWVKPKNYSSQIHSASKQPVKTSPRVHVVYQERVHKTPAVPEHRRQSRLYYRNNSCESSSSDESVEIYRKKSKWGVSRRPYQNHHTVYTAQMPAVELPNPTAEKGKNPPFKKRGKLVDSVPQHCESKDFCGLSCEAEEVKSPESDNNRVSSVQQTDNEDDDMDLLCYPSERFLKNTALAAESGSKLRWRIIIKRGEEK